MNNKVGPQAPIKSPPINGKDNDFNKPSIQVSDWNGRSPVTTPAKPASSYKFSFKFQKCKYIDLISCFKPGTAYQNQ